MLLCISVKSDSTCTSGKSDHLLLKIRQIGGGMREKQVYHQWQAQQDEPYRRGSSQAQQLLRPSCALGVVHPVGHQDVRGDDWQSRWTGRQHADEAESHKQG
ncbi:uncharacterized protein LOC125526430 [Triticum urartu]|uniref:uncharacterized protein LOC125526430 n=1 Tax=Triticum urartu TaxID=4572 RepID=UPI00204491DA|nr:uncharacterized protein LOC125526430 [Triticum urartu]